MDEEVQDFLEHFGVRGMKWGFRKNSSLDRVDRVANGVDIRKKGFQFVRKGKAQSGDFGSRPGGQKALLIGGGIAGWVAAGAFTNRILGTKMPITQLALTGAGSVAGVRATRAILDHHKNLPVSRIH